MTHSVSQSEKAQPPDVNNLIAAFSSESLKFNPLKATLLGVSDYNHLFLPEITLTNRQKEVDFLKKYLKQLKNISPQKLTYQEQLTYELFKHDLEIAIESFDYPSHYLPFNQIFGAHNAFALLGSGESAQPFRTLRDYERFIQRAQGFSLWVDSAINTMREGAQKGTTHPEAIVKKIAAQLAAHLSYSPSENIFYQPLQNLPRSLSVHEKYLLASRYQATVENTIIASYQKLYHFLVKEYLPLSRKTAGYGQLENGQNWYRFLVRQYTTSELSTEEIHRLGLEEVKRIRNEMTQVKEQLEFEGSLAEFFSYLRQNNDYYFNSEAELLNAYRGIQEKIHGQLYKLFSFAPQASYVVKTIPSYRAQAAPGAYYQSPSLDGKVPGIFYINSYNLKAQPRFLVETLSLHEAAPGHHFQIAIQQESSHLSSYRRFNSYTSFAEGWALYAESLGKELGLFNDPIMWYGRLVDEQLRAMRLVVDTGIHAKGWSREKAIAYMMENSSMARSDVVAEVERYMVIPAQALAYKLGERTFQKLRTYASSKLGKDFDIRAFHKELLIDGSLPLPILERKLKTWVNSKSFTR
ncbi:DUF885 family protein [Aliikangiella sp. G2MR2-5]|uniref:DUF885 domain-containing protein n=1 Tax=Aliikangiella sp. G2MR2-5 TaxID=2788943 RepID=UPI001AEEEA50|nr:DUF885 domain-containing protein [Aliikangiella sp. G2MR2-5]